MKKITFLILVILNVFTVNCKAQSCFSFVDTTRLSFACGDSVQLAANFYKATIIATGSTHALYSVFFTSPDTGYVAGSVGTILKTVDAGNTWTTLSSGTTATLYSIYFTDANTGYAGGYINNVFTDEGVILKTTDAGATWTNLLDTTNTYGIHSFYFIDADTVYASYITPSGGGVIKTTNAGNTWNLCTVSANASVYSVFFTSPQKGFGVGGGTNIIKSTNYGLNWSPALSGLTYLLYSVYFTDANHGFIAGALGNYYSTEDAGVTWNHSTIGTVNLNNIYFIDHNTGYILGASGRIYKTLNGGKTWYQVYSGLTTPFYSMCSAGPNVQFVVSSAGKIIKISDINNATFDWQPSIGLDYPNSATPKAKPGNTTTYHVTITPNSGTGCSNITTDSVKVKINQLSAPELCMVSIRNNKNFVMWNKTVSTAIDSFYVWRETDVTNIYEKICSVAYSDSSMYVDNTSNPEIQSNKYKLSLKDLCKVQSDKSSVAHKTMHLTINQGMGTTWNLIWEAYEGFTVSTYRILRGTDPVNLSLIGTTSGSSTQYTDYSAPAGIIYYQVEVINPNMCNPSKGINKSVSNIATNNPITGINQQNMMDNVKIHPNPANKTLFIDGISNEIVNIYNVDGTLLLSKMLKTNQVDISSLTKGMYFIKLTNSDVNIVRKFIKD